MQRRDISEKLMKRKIEDYHFNSGLMPYKAKILSKTFARSLGMSASKILSTYDTMYSQIGEGLSTPSIESRLRSDLNSRSKVEIKLPFGKTRKSRICGLVAMNYSKFFDYETQFYSNLINDLEKESLPEMDLSESVRFVSEKNEDKYSELLSNKQQSIYDFGVLMGLIDDSKRFKELSGSMPRKMEDYFTKISKAHKGGRMGIGWPLPLKKFSGAIQNNFYRDSIAFYSQEGVGKDFNFSLPQEGKYKKIVNEIKSTSKKISDSDSLLQKWKVARALPTSLFFLSGMGAYAQDLGLQNKSQEDYMNAALSAATLAATTADEDDGIDSGDFITTWFMWFTSLV